MKHIVKTEADWLLLRKKYITASEASVLVGADPYSSPAKIRNPSPFFGNAYTKVGQMLEPIVVSITNDVLKLTGDARFTLYENLEGHKEFYTKGRLGATPDAHANRQMLLEAKTTRPHTYLKYSAVPPSKYVIQLLVQMLCTDIKIGYLAILSTDLTQASAELNWPISVFKVLRSDELCNILETEAERFTVNEKFRVDSKVKQTVALLLQTCWEKII